MGIVALLIGRRLPNREAEARRIGALEAVPAMGLDALGSTAYGPEAALLVLAPLGAAGPPLLGWVMAPVVGLLAILFASYWQTIRAYPGKGGAYFVARENLGTQAGLLAAAALMVDFILNVAVGISAGVGALVSRFPGLHPHALALCLAILMLLTLINLRGIPESGRLLAVPTYVFIASFAAIVAIGVGKALVAGGPPPPVEAPAAVPPAIGAAGAWLLLRAFASGCTALTGIEAVSNSMSAFRDPPAKYGHRTLAVIVGALAVLLTGVCWLIRAYGIGASDEANPGYRSVLAQLAGAVLGRGAFFDVAIAALLLVLLLSANTSFVGFPRLCQTVAEDGFLPRPFALPGRRLAFSLGVLFLAGTAALLLVAFGGITTRLVPLFAIGAFASFTLSQAAMVVHWRRCRRSEASARSRHRVAQWTNAAGALASGTALLIIVVAKFGEGAWITVLVIPALVAVFRRTRRYYALLARSVEAVAPPDLRALLPPIVIVVVDGVNRLGTNAIVLGLSLSSDVVALHLTRLEGPDSGANEHELRRRWRTQIELPAREAGLAPPRLMIVPTQRRTLHEPVLRLVRKVAAEFPDRRVAVLIPELVKRRWYQQLLHAHRARRLRAALLRAADPRLTVVSVPWRVDALA